MTVYPDRAVPYHCEKCWAAYLVMDGEQPKPSTPWLCRHCDGRIWPLKWVLWQDEYHDVTRIVEVPGNASSTPLTMQPPDHADVERLRKFAFRSLAKQKTRHKGRKKRKRRTV